MHLFLELFILQLFQILTHCVYLTTDVNFFDCRMTKDLHEIDLPLLFSPANQETLTSKFLQLRR